MATNRVLLGNRQHDSSGYGLYVSKADSNVLTCDRKDLLFDSSQKRGGEVYAGGSQSSLSNSGQSFLSTSSKDSLGYIPLVIATEDKRGDFDITDGDETWSGDTIDFIETTTSTIKPKSMDGAVQSSTTSLPNPVGNRRSGEECTNIKFMVLKIPCAYGYMTSAYFDT